MSKFKSKMLAVALAATTVLSSVVPSAALAAEPVESDAPAAATTEVAAEVEPEEKAVEESVIEVVEAKEDASDNGGTDASSGKTTADEIPVDEGNTTASETGDNAEKAGTEKTGETEEITDDKQPVEETKEEDKAEKKYRFRIDFDGGAGAVKVILASDEGASKDDPSAAIIKDADGNTDKKFRNDNVEALAVNEDDTALAFELKEGEKIEVITESAEGYKISEYRVTTDSGADVDAEPTFWEYTLNENTALKVTIEKKPEKAQNGSVAVKVGSAGGTVTVTNGETSYTVVKAEDGTVTVTDQNGNAVKSESEFDLVVEDEIGKTISVKAAADQGAHVTAFAVAAGETAEESAFKAEDKPAEFAQDIEIAQGQKVVTVAFIAMPEFTAEQTVGKYIVKVHAAAGILPAGTVAEVKELSATESKPYVKKAEKMADEGVATVVIDIRFLDTTGKEIQPNGEVEVIFDNAVEDDATMSVYHAVDNSVNKMERIPTDTDGDSVQFKSESFSPFILLAATSEPNWTLGGSGTRTNVSDQLAIIHNNKYKYSYDDYGYGDGDTYCYGMYLNGSLVGWSYCVDPMFQGNDLDGQAAGAVFVYTAPMIVKAAYYGASGPRNDVIKSATGESEYGALNIVTHVAMAEIMSRMGYTNNDPNDSFSGYTTNELKDDVYKYVKALESLPTPDNFYVYTTEQNGRYRQNFAFGSTPLTSSVRIQKSSANTSLTNGNKCYSFEGARYWIYTSEATARARGNAGWVSGGTLICDANGVSNTFTIAPGTYYLIEGVAPKGYKLSDTVTPFTVGRGQSITVSTGCVVDQPLNDPINLVINKKNKNGGEKINSLAGTEFTMKYYDGYYNASTLPASATKTWVLTAYEPEEYPGRYYADFTHVTGDALYKDTNGVVTLPLGTITIQETKAAEGYINDGKFGDANMYIGQVIASSETTSGAKLVDIQGARATGNTFNVSDTPTPPGLPKTEATDKASGTHTAYAGGDITIVDKVVYENLVVGKEYTMRGKLVDKATGETIKDAEGNEVTAEKTFTPTTINGSVEIEFNFKADTAFKKKTTVAFETLLDEGKEVATHADINDEPQTVRFPEIGTSAVNPDTEGPILPAAKDAKIEDTVSYKNLVPGVEYTVKGVLMDKETNQPFIVGGEKVTAEKTFTPDAEEGSVIVTFQFDATGLSDKGLVVFEELYANNTIIADHKDITDAGQTVRLPGVLTEANDKDTEKKNTLAAEDRVIEDKVSYKGLIPGKKYVITGEVKIQSEDAENFDDAETVPSTIVDAQGEGTISFDEEKVTFTPSTSDGEIVVSFKVDASELAGEALVVGETVEYNGVKIAVHRDIFDEPQTVYVPDGQTMAVDTETGIKNTLAAENRVFKDTFSYENLLPGETYRFTGTVVVETGKDDEGNILVEEIPSVMVDEEGNPVENGFVEFVPEEKDGTLDLYFSIDATMLENRNVTVFEKVTLDGKPVIIHEELDGTQTVYVPEGKTTVVDSESQDQIAMPDEEVTVIDTLAYKNLIPGTEYTVTGRVMRKIDASEIPSELTEAAFKEGTEGTQIFVADSVATFTPETTDGELELTFVFSASELKGEDVVIFERVYHNDKEVIIHENIDDESQTVHLPDGHTTAADPDTDDRTIKPEGDVTIRDRVFYENLIPGDEYVIHGKVMLKPAEEGGEATELEAKMVDAEGNEVEEWIFTPEEKDGSEDIFFVINADSLAGRSVVLFETMEFINPELQTRTTIVVHEDIDDEDETVHFPDGGTTALDSDTGSHESYADEEVTILDEVKFINLIPGKPYTVNGVLMDKKTGKPALSNGKEIVSTKEFVPETADGSVIIEFTFNGVDLAGETVVAFEKVLSNGKEVFVHEDIEDEEQTVYLPKVKTSAVDKKDGDREIAYSGTVTVVDTVKYENLIPGTKYHVTGVLMNKSTKQPAKAGGKEITGDATFVAKEANGTVEVAFRFDSSKLSAGEYVVFETLYEVNAQTKDEKVVGSHKDINDASQTVKRPNPPKKNPRTGDDSNVFMWLMLFAAAAAGTAGAVIIRKKKTGR